MSARIFAILLAVAAMASASSARAQEKEKMTLAELVKHVKPSIALIEVIENGKRISNGSGYVVDAKGVIATNYHVIEGAKEMRVSFPGNKDLGAFKAEGFIGYYPKKDMALIKIDPKDKKLAAIPLAKELPEQGEQVVAFGAPLGYSDTVTDGIVSAIRTGKELTAMMTRGGQDGYGKDGLGYEVDATWLQTSAPISPGNSGGPLVNMKGEVVGMNTFVSTIGQNLNFSLSIIHMIEFIEKSGSNVQSFANLPEPRQRRGPSGPSGDPKKTLDVWKDFNRARNELDKEIEICEKSFRSLPPINPRNPMQGQNVRNRKITDAFKKMSNAFDDYAEAISKLDNKDCDPDLIKLIVIDTVVAKKVGQLCTDVSNSASAGGGSVDWERATSQAKRAFTENDTQRELLRVNMGLKFNLSFPTLSETAEEDAKLAKEGKKPGGKATAENPERSKMRIWTDSTGQFKINAKCLGIKDGKVKLEREDGTVIEVPLDKLSEADKRFLASTG